MRWRSLTGLACLAVACTPPEPAAPSTTTVDVTPPAAGSTPPEPLPPEPPPAGTTSPETPPPSEPPAGAAPSAPAPSAAAPASEPTRKQPSAAEVKACAARGGKIEPVCLTAHLTCVVRYRDAGKRCTDKADCQGDCLYEGEIPPPPRPSGHCQATSDPCGCKAPMIKGQVQPTLCAD